MKKQLTLILLLTGFALTGFAQSCDTLFNMQSSLDTAYLYTVGPPQLGYIAGNNGFGDLAKAEGFATTLDDSVTAAVLFFGACSINASDSNDTVKVYVWDNTGTSATGLDGAPGNAIDSAVVTLAQIAQVVTSVNANQTLEGLEVFFNGRAALTDTTYVGVLLPTKTGDTVALFMNNGYPVDNDGDGWELISSGTWGSYNDDWTWGGNVGNYIEAIICGSGPSAIITPSASSDVSVYPNPAEDLINIGYNGQETNTKYALFDLLGNEVLAGNLTNTVTSLNISSIAAGAYLLKVGENQEQSFKIIKVK